MRWASALVVVTGCVGAPDRPPATGVARTWTKRVDIVEPGQRVPGYRDNPRLVYDPHRERVLMYEGGAYASPIADTLWELDPEVGWTVVCDQCLASAAPVGAPGRHTAAFVDDPGHDRIVMYGGTDDSDVDHGELWELDGDAWKLVPTTGDAPSPRRQNQLVYDPAVDGLWLLGGYATGSPIYMETFLLKGTEWLKVEPAPDAIMSSPGIESVYDPQRERILMREDGNVLFDTLWEHTAQGWTRLCGDCSGNPRRGASMVHLPEYDQTFLLGGYNDDGNIAGTQVLVDDRFVTYDAGGALPPRESPGLVYDPSRDVVVLYGGRGSDEDCDTIGNCGGTFELVRE